MFNHRAILVCLAASSASAQCDPATAFPTVNPIISAQQSSDYIETADLNGDGALDLIITGFLETRVGVRLGNGDGTYQPIQSFFVGSLPTAIAIGQLGGDASPDIVVSNLADDDVSILIGNGDGTFQPQQRYPAGGAPDGLDIGDLTGDGLVDIAVSDRSAGQLVILEAQPDGTFTTLQTVPTGALPGAVQIFDLTGTGRGDIAVANSGEGTVTVLQNMGIPGPDNMIAFTTSTHAVGVTPTAIAAGDVDGDGADDLITANLNSNDISVLIAASGALMPEIRLSTGERPIDIRTADLDGAAPNEIFVATRGTSGVAEAELIVFAMTAPDVFTPHPFDLSFDIARGLAVGDLDGDSDTDAAVVTTGIELLFSRCIIAPEISMLTPGPIFLEAGASATLSVALSGGSQPIAFQWRKNGIPLVDDGRIIGTTTDTLTITSTLIQDTDMYDVTVTNDQGTDTSESVLLAVRGESCPGDTDNSGTVNFADLVATLFLFGPCPE